MLPDRGFVSDRWSRWETHPNPTSLVPTRDTFLFNLNTRDGIGRRSTG